MLQATDTPTPRQELLALLEDRLSLEALLPGQQIAQLAARLLDMPMALVTLITEDVQWNLGRIGIDDEETDLVDSFCVFCLRPGQGSVVNHAVHEPHVAASKYVKHPPHVRSYASWPITLSGMVMGSVCVFDTQKRFYGPEALGELQTLAAWMERALEGYIENKRAQGLNHRAFAALSAAKQWLWEADAKGRIRWVSCPLAHDAFLCDKEGEMLPCTVLVQRDGTPIEGYPTLQDYLDKGRAFFELRTIHPTRDGSRIVERSATPTIDSSGQVIWNGVGKELVPEVLDRPTQVHDDKKLIVYVEDSVTNATLMREMLAGLPWKLVICPNGKDALAYLMRHRPDLLLLDMKLPDMSGLDLWKILITQGRMPTHGCVIVSADVFTDGIEKARAQGIRDYWTKPLDYQTVLSRIHTLLGA